MNRQRRKRRSPPLALLGIATLVLVGAVSWLAWQRYTAFLSGSDGADGSSGMLNVDLTTGKSWADVGGRRISVEGTPMGADGFATLVGMASFGSGPLASDTLRIMVEVQVGN